MKKNAIFLVFVVVVSALFWFWLKPWIGAPTRFSDFSIWVRPLLSFSVLVAILGLSFLLIKEYYFKILISLAAGVPFLAVFGFNRINLAALLILVLLQMLSIRNFKNELKQRVDLSIKNLMRHGLPFVITSLLILVSFAYFLSSGVQDRAKSGQLPPTVGQVIEKTIDNFLGENIKSLPPQEQRAVKNQVVGEMMDRLTESFQPYLRYLPPVLAFGLFLVLQGLSFIFIWISILFAYLLFILLKKVGMVKIRVVQKEAQEIEF